CRGFRADNGLLEIRGGVLPKKREANLSTSANPSGPQTCEAALRPRAGQELRSACREWMVRENWTRCYVNSSVGCIKRMFKWAVENELVPSSVIHGLQAVAGLKKGRSPARETKPIRPVAHEHMAAVLPFLNKAHQAMVHLQRYTGMRPGEVRIMRPCD